MNAEIPRFQNPEQQSQAREISPYQRLLGDVFGRPQLPISPEREQQLAQTFQEVFLELPPSAKRVEVLTLRYGLSDGVPHKVPEIANLRGVRRQAIYQQIKTALMRLSLPQKSRRLKDFLSLSQDSVARSIVELEITEGELEPLVSAPLSELGTVAPLVQSVFNLQDLKLESISSVLSTNSQPFFDYFYRDEIKTLKETLGQIFKKAQAGHYAQLKEPETDKRSVVYLITDLDLPPEELRRFFKVDISVLGPELYLVLYVNAKLGNSRRVLTIGELLKAEAQPFFDHLSSTQIENLREELRKIYTERSRFFNKLFPDIEIPTSILEEIDKLPIEELGVDTLIRNSLKRAQIDTIGDVLTMADEELLSVRSFGHLSLSHLKEKLLEKITQVAEEQGVKLEKYT